MYLVNDSIVEEKNIHNVYVNLGASNHTDDERSENDFYATPPIAVRHLMEVETFNKNIWEPACGMHHIPDILKDNGYDVYTTDIVDMLGRGIEIKDFLETDINDKWHGDIITNPPFKYATEFVKHALDIVEDGAKVAMFLKLQFLEGAKRIELFEEYPPKIVYIAAKRYGCSKTGKFNKDGNVSSAICYSWYIWEKGFKGDPIIKWINKK